MHNFFDLIVKIFQKSLFGCISERFLPECYTHCGIDEKLPEAEAFRELSALCVTVI